uniref:Dihydrolipoyl dehydrogenase n=1 Tax=Roseihalotalea indica TaxID=2867963 RepID=A0AA49GSH1_9BACT|nr:dihydrolipoyl dehydrogenase [Tunicatimonas sp. TK19036]
MAEYNHQVLVIGGGPGGYAAAFMAADLGMDVALVDPEANPGGVCLYRGCIPSKALLHAVNLKREALEASDWGITFSEPKLDVKQLRQWKEGVVEKLTGGLGQLTKQRKITYYRGYATLQDGHTVSIDLEEKDSKKVTFENAILATGSAPVELPELPFSDRIMHSEAALSLSDVPKSLLVVGAGYIGLEIGTIYSGLGSKVSLVEMTDGLMPGADRDMVKEFWKRNEDSFEQVMLETKVVEAKEQKKSVKVTFEGKQADDGESSYEKILVAVGRKPRTEGIGLENVNIELDEKGFIPVNAQRQTHESSIYAIGDITGEPMLAHKAHYEGKIAAEAIAGHNAVYEPKAIPAVVFTDPEMAWCGLTETQAKAEGIEVNVSKFPWSASGRAITLGRQDGFTKILFDPETERVLGVGIVGKGAGDLIPEAVLAVEMAAVARDITLTIHPHPTLSETFMEAADALFGQSTHIYRKKKKKEKETAE